MPAAATTTAPATLLCVHPHPDDEAIACGGVLARSAAEGIRTVVVTCTGGEAGENLAGIDLGDVPLVEHRRRELDAAIAILGVSVHERLGYRDSGMVGTPDNEHPDCFHQADLEEAASRLAAIIRRERPQAVVSDDANGTYGHPDHVKANRVTIRAVELAADPSADVAGEPWQIARRYVHTFSRGRLEAAHAALLAAGLPSPFTEDVDAGPADESARFGTPDELVTTRIDIRTQIATKLAAMRAHASQMAPDSFFMNIPEELVDEFLGQEEFVLEDGAPFPDAATQLIAR
jgi:N-acetyl-1-D-myo-inositol-2-amino-2-deoxy-alpha-D-glucopyranoside deacetylase